jgi:hypothetical protein
VKTTPKPKATKNRSGELVGPALLLLLLEAVDVAAAEDKVDDGVAIATKIFVLLLLLRAQWRWLSGLSGSQQWCIRVEREVW